MKKTLVLLLSAALLSTLISCQAPDEELPPTETDSATTQETERATEAEGETEPLKETEKETEAHTEPQTEAQNETQTVAQNDQPTLDAEKYCAYNGISNIEAFLHTRWEEQNELHGDAQLNGQTTAVSILVPILINTDYEFLELRQQGDDNTGCLEWVFSRVGLHPWDADIQRDQALVQIHFSPTAYDDILEYYGFTPQTYGPYSTFFGFDSNWYFQFEGYTIAVKLPLKEYDATGNPPFEKIADYFVFDTVTYSPTAETDAVQ